VYSLKASFTYFALVLYIFLKRSKTAAHLEHVINFDLMISLCDIAGFYSLVIPGNEVISMSVASTCPLRLLAVRYLTLNRWPLLGKGKKLSCNSAWRCAVRRLDNRLTDGGEVVGLKRRLRFPPRGRLNQPQSHSAAGRIRSNEKCNDFIGNRSHDLPACSTVPQSTNLCRAIDFCYHPSLFTICTSTFSKLVEGG
jgi:hypothetical protein